MTYALCGLKVVSELPLPDLLPWTGDGRAPDVEIRLGEVTERLENAAYDVPPFQAATDGVCRVSVAGVATYEIVRGRRITVQPHSGAAHTDIRVFLLGTAFGLLFHQRGLLPLHAGCVAIGGRAVAFSGRSGEGKSTLAAAFLRHGYPVLADDVTVVDTDAPDGPLVLPSIPRIKLRRDAISALGLTVTSPPPGRVEPEKHHMAVNDSLRTSALPLAALYHLTTADDAAPTGIERLRGVEAIDALVGAVYRRAPAQHMGLQASVLAAVMRVATLPSFRLSRIRNLDALGETVATLAARHGG